MPGGGVANARSRCAPRRARSPGRRPRGVPRSSLAPQLTASVRAPPSVATSRSPGRAPAAEQRRRAHAQQHVVARMRVPGREPVGQQRVIVPARQERLALDAGVAAVGKTGARHEQVAPVGSDRPDASTELVGCDQIAGEPAEGHWRHRDPALNAVGLRRDHAHRSVTVDGVDRCVLAGGGGDQQPMAEASRVVERDPVDQAGRGDRGERPHPTLGVDRHHPPWLAEADRVRRVSAEAAAAAAGARKRDVCLEPWVRVVGRGEWPHGAGSREQPQPAVGRHHHPAVVAGSDHVDRAREVDVRRPARGLRRPLCGDRVATADRQRARCEDCQQPLSQRPGSMHLELRDPSV